MVVNVPTSARTVQARLTAQIERLQARLVREETQVPPTVVHEWIERAWARFAGARVPDFVPILVERTVRAQVRATSDRFEVPEDVNAQESLRSWARRTAGRFLAEQLPRRWAHTQGVARRAEQVARVMPVRDQPVLVAAAWLHDIGYARELAHTGFHPLDGARYLARQDVPWQVCTLVAHHSGAAAVAELLGLADELAAFQDDHSQVRDALWYCDMTTDPDGHPITAEKRLAEIRQRRGPHDPVVRALTLNQNERIAAVRHTHHLLSVAAA